MSLELNVRFTSSDRFTIKFDDRETDALEFKAPVNDGDRADIHWYLESYAAQYMTDVGDRSADLRLLSLAYAMAVESRSRMLCIYR